MNSLSPLAQLLALIPTMNERRIIRTIETLRDNRNALEAIEKAYGFGGCTCRRAPDDEGMRCLLDDLPGDYLLVAAIFRHRCDHTADDGRWVLPPLADQALQEALHPLKETAEGWDGCCELPDPPRPFRSRKQSRVCTIMGERYKDGFAIRHPKDPVDCIARKVRRGMNGEIIQGEAIDDNCRMSPVDAQTADSQAAA